MSEEEIEDWLRGYSYDQYTRRKKKGEIIDKK